MEYNVIRRIRTTRAREIAMNTDAIREWLTNQPFRPFVLNLSNGESHEVRHPENVAIGKTRIAVTWPETDKFVHISLIHINSIEKLQTAL